MYMDYLLPGLIAFIISVLAGPLLIPFLTRLKAGQTVRDDGPQSHLKKNGTPTMGGFIFLLGFWIVCLIYSLMGQGNPEMYAVLISVTGFAAIGFIDDFIKVVLKRSMGFRAWQKFLCQMILSVFIIWYMVREVGITTEVMLPFANSFVDLGSFTYVLLFVMILGTVNGANFTDGLDGLASSVTAVIGVFMVLAAIALDSEGAAAGSAMVGALLGFLIYNSHKASVFMGDTGSLALGGYVAAAAIGMQIPLHIIIVAFIYLLEVASVIIQVGYFKLTKGKRVFRMAPIHHHYELGGHKETKVVAAFTIVTAVLCVITLLSM